MNPQNDLGLTAIIVNDFAYVNGGASQIAITTAVSLAKKGMKVIFFSIVGPVDLELENNLNIEIICLEGFDILNDPSRLRAIFNGLWNHKAAAKFIRVLEKHDPRNTVIHIHTCSKALSSSIVRVSLTKKYKVIYHLHDYGIACPNLGFYNYKNQTICNLKPLGSKCFFTDCDSRSYPHKIWRFFRQLVQLKFGKLPSEVKYFIAVSNFSLNILKKYLPKNSKKFLLNNPIKVTRVPPANVGKNKKIIFVGRLSKEKDPLSLAYVVNDLSLDAVFVGEGELSSEIKQVCQTAEITGWVNSDQVNHYIRNSRILILTSRLYETQGMVVSEAAANGVPSIVPDTSAATEFITNNVSGLIYRSGDKADLVEKIKVLEDDNKVIDMGLAAYRNFWESTYSIDEYINKLIEIYKEILE